MYKYDKLTVNGVKSSLITPGNVLSTRKPMILSPELWCVPIFLILSADLPVYWQSLVTSSCKPSIPSPSSKVSYRLIFIVSCFMLIHHDRFPGLNLLMNILSDDIKLQPNNLIRFEANFILIFQLFD